MASNLRYDICMMTIWHIQEEYAIMTGDMIHTCDTFKLQRGPYVKVTFMLQPVSVYILMRTHTGASGPWCTQKIHTIFGKRK